MSCSSDLTVKLWRPQSSTAESPETIGHHTDYVKCLAAPRDGAGGWVASGGLDRKIRIWDIAGKGQTLEIDSKDEGKAGTNPKGSVYALAYGGGILASGGPESIVRLWDPRSGKPVTKFVGHTDNIRDILVSEQGDYILSASSDTTVKLWSLTGGRCLHTLSMHNDSVWSLFSSHPGLDIFYSSDRTGLVAKTDVRNVKEIDEGLCVAVCQERDGVRKVVSCGEYIWTTTSSSSIKRWRDVDTDAELAKSPVVGRSHAASSASTRPKIYGHVSHGSHSSVASPLPSPQPKTGSAIPLTSLLRLSTTSPLPTRDPDAETVYSIASARQASISEAMLEADHGVVIPINEQPEETIKGQDGLTKHFLLNDRRRVLTLDTAGNVIMWDLIRCTPIHSYGMRDLEDVAAEVNTVEAVANWCQVDTRTGQLTCVLEENYCFDAEMYADEIDFEIETEFREDQRINLGRWVLRCLFDKLITEQLNRDAEYRAVLDKEAQEKEAARPLPQLTIPATTMENPESPIGDGVATPRAIYPQTPGLSIALATPGLFHTSSLPAEPINDENDSTPPIRTSMQAPASPTVDYFSSAPVPHTQTTGIPPTPGGVSDAPTSPSSEVPPTAEASNQAQGSFLGKFRLGTKKGRGDASSSSKPTTSNGHDETKPSETEPAAAPVQEQIYEETLGGMLKRLRASYAEEKEKPTSPSTAIASKLAPCIPTEAPFLALPPNTAIIIQSDHPDSGGVSDLYRGTTTSVSSPNDIALLEEHAPAWLGDVLLLNKFPAKEPVKISFVLMPWRDLLPAIGIGEGGLPSRLNANRMLRCRKVVGYVAERLPAEMIPTTDAPKAEEEQGKDKAQEGEAATAAVSETKPEDWLELVCQGQVVQPNQTLTTLRSHVWKSGGDVALYYRRKDWKEMEEKAAREAEAAGKEGEVARVEREEAAGSTQES